MRYGIAVGVAVLTLIAATAGAEDGVAGSCFPGGMPGPRSPSGVGRAVSGGQGADGVNVQRVSVSTSLTKIRSPEMAGWAHVGPSATT